MPQARTVYLRLRYYAIRFCLITILTYGGLYLVFYTLHLRLNTTSSQPIGLYRLSSFARPPYHGELVLFEPPTHLNSGIDLGRQRGFFGQAMIKRIIALPGDTVLYDRHQKQLQVIRRGESVPVPIADSEVFDADSQGRPMPHPFFPDIVPEGYVFLGSNHVRGFDSRYYGCVPQSLLTSHVTPFLQLVGS